MVAEQGRLFDPRSATEVGVDKTFGKDWPTTLSAKQEEAIRDYQAVGYGRLNGMLRGTLDRPLRSAEKRQATQEVQMIESTMRPLAEGVTVYRGLGPEMFTGTEDGPTNENFDWKTVVGRTFQDKGFVSTSIAPGSEFRWVMAEAEIHVAAGTKASYPGALTGALQNMEKELLLEPGLRFRVTGASVVPATDERGSYAKLAMEVVK